MLKLGQRDLFDKSIIAQHDDEDYSESGYVAVVIGRWAAIGAYGHCSCYDTWASLTGGGISDDEGPSDPSWLWQGTPEELLRMARLQLDPAMPLRQVDPKDSDYDHLVALYQQIVDKAVMLDPRETQDADEAMRHDWEEEHQR